MCGVCVATAVRLLDAGCGVGGSTRHLFRDYGLASAVGITLSPAQVSIYIYITLIKIVKGYQGYTIYIYKYIRISYMYIEVTYLCLFTQ